MQISEMTQREQVLYFNVQDELVANRTMEESTAAEYAAVCIERARAYRAKIAAMKIPLYLTAWASDMTGRTGKSLVKAHHNYLPWLDAFLVSRYGEAVEHWPDELTEKDLQRARDWKLKGLPKSFIA